MTAVRKRAVAGVIIASSFLIVLCSHVIGAPVPLKFVADVPLTGKPTRLDYESLDKRSGVLYIAHMGDGSVIAFNTRSRRVVATIPGITLVRGVLAVPQVHRVFAAAEGDRNVAVIDMGSNRVMARLPAGDVDGLAYDPVSKRIFASDETGNRDVVIDAVHHRVIGSIALGGEAGNTVYDGNTGHILVAVQTTNELVEIDPRRLTIVGRFALPGSAHLHGIALDEATHFAFVAGEFNASVLAFNMRTKQVTSRASVGGGVDVLSVDPALGRLYVASESGIVSVFDVRSGGFRKLGESKVALNAHVVLADPRTHLVYFPLRNVRGRPTLRVMSP